MSKNKMIMNKMKIILLLLLFGINMIHSYGQTISEEAKKHYDRGQIATELAQTKIDYEDAINEYNEAIKLAPEWPDPYLALGMVQEKIEKYSDAIINYKKYIELDSTANNLEEIKTKINKLEYKSEKKAEKEKIIDLLVKWNTPESNIQLKITNGSPGGVYTLKNFILHGENLKAYIPCYMKEIPNLRNKLILAEQTVPVEFDGKIMKYNYDYYNCPTLPEFQYCHYTVKIKAELISVSPLKFKVKEEWKYVEDGKLDIYDAEWEFTE